MTSGAGTSMKLALAAVDATACAMEGTVICTNRADGRPPFCTTPCDGMGGGTTGATGITGATGAEAALAGTAETAAALGTALTMSFATTFVTGALWVLGARVEETVTGFDAAGVDTLTGAAFTGTLADTLGLGVLAGAFEAILGLAFGTTLGAGLETDLPPVLTTGLAVGLVVDLANGCLGTGFLANGVCAGTLAFTPGLVLLLATTFTARFATLFTALLATLFTTGLALALVAAMVLTVLVLAFTLTFTEAERGASGLSGNK